MQIVKIKGCVKNYDWGSRDILPSMFHYQPDGTSQAEMWFGVHPSGPSRLEDGTLLSDYLNTDPERFFGPRHKEYQERFPLMMKVLAVNNPLSLHVHPDAVQALRGWQDEELMRSRPENAGQLNFRDTNQKCELFYALTPSTLLCGFRDFESASHHLRRLLPLCYDEYFAKNRTLRGLVKTLYSLDEGCLKRAVDEFLMQLDEAEEESRRGGLYLTERGISEKSFSLFGYDAGVIMPYLMNVVPVRPGEAIYIQSGVLHSYAHGTGIEIEDSSDNEIRLSLSRKHKDIQGALNLIDFDSSFSGKVCLKPDSVLRSVASTPTFALAVLSSGSYDIREKTPCFSLCLEGLARVGTPDDHIMLREGECCFIPSCDEEYHVRVSGKVYQALFSADEE